MNKTLPPRFSDPAKNLQIAYDSALAFRLNKVSNLAVTQVRANEFGEQEAAFHTIGIDEHGMSGGMRLNLLQPVHSLAAEWRDLWDNFTTAMQPKMADINAVTALQAEADLETKQKNDEVDAVERELRQSSRYGQIDDHYQRSKDHFNMFRDKYGNRKAVMFARHPTYLALLCMVMLTECFINYHAFNAFWGVPAVALGTTVILGVLLALAAHGYGEILKQWSFRFGPDRDPAMRWTDWRMFGMYSSALFIVLAFTGWARWAAALERLGSQNLPSALGGLGVVQVNPIRDVCISLIANLGAWMVGVIISYLAHDLDPDYMSATKQYYVAKRAWNRARANQTIRLKHIEAKHAKIIQEKTKAAGTRRKSVTQEMDMLEQVSARNQAVQHELESVLNRNVEVYRDALVKIALSRQGQVQIVRAETNTPFSPSDYKVMRIAPATFSQLAA